MSLHHCPNCRAPLPASRAAILGCTYCGHSVRVRAEAPARPSRPSQAPAQLPAQPQRKSSYVAWFIAVPLVLMLVVGGAVAWMVNDRVAAAHDQAVAASARAEQQSQAARARIDESLKETLAEAIPEEPEANERRPARKRQIRKPKRRRRPAKPAATKAPSNLPKTPPAAAVERVLGRVDALKCVGVTKVGYTLDIKPDGTSKVAAKGPIWTKGPSGRCVDEQVKKLRFPKSQDGMRIKHIYYGPDNK